MNVIKSCGMTNELREKIPPRPPLVNGGWGDLNGAQNGPHHESDTQLHFFMSVSINLGEGICGNIL